MQLPAALILAFAALSASAPTKETQQMSQMCHDEDGMCNEAARNNWMQNGRSHQAHQETDGMTTGLTGSKMTGGRMSHGMSGAQVSATKDSHLLWHSIDDKNAMKNDMKAPRSDVVDGHLVQDGHQRELGIRSHLQSAVEDNQPRPAMAARDEQQRDGDAAATCAMGAGRCDAQTAQQDARLVRANAFFAHHIDDVAQLQTCDQLFGAAQTARSCMTVRSPTGSFIMTCQGAHDVTKAAADKDATSCIVRAAEQSSGQQGQQTTQPGREATDGRMGVADGLGSMSGNKVSARGELCPSDCDCAQFVDGSYEQFQCATNAQCQELGCSFVQSISH